jgi:hypothetical protein
MREAMKTALILRVVEGLLCAGMIVALVPLAPAQGQPLGVNVSFEFTAPEIVNAFDNANDRKSLEQDITSRIVSSLQTRLHYWTFTPVAQSANATIKLGLRETDAVILWLKLLSPSGTELKSWDAVIFPPGELIRRGIPSKSEWLSTLPPAFEDKLLKVNSQDILEQLEATAPVGKDFAFMPPPADSSILPRVVLALDWAKYSDLSECQFRLRYDWSQGGKVTIHSSGISMPFAFTPQNRQFDGIAVQLESWQQGGTKVNIDQMRQHLGELAPVEFYLEAIKGPGSE